MRQRTQIQNKKMYRLWNQLSISGDLKSDMVYSYTEGRTIKSSEMFVHEAEAMINFMAAQDVSPQVSDRQKQKRKIIAICYDMGWTNGKGKIDMYRIDAFLVSPKSAVKKTLNALDSKELSKIIHQFEQLRTYHLNTT